MDESISSRVAEALAAETEFLPPGTRLPSSRALIQRFGVSASTISAALALLSRRGLVETRPGSGTFRSAARTPVRTGDTSWQETSLDLADGAAAPGTARRFQAPALLSTLTTPGPEVIDLNGGYLHPELQPLTALGSALARAARRQTSWQRPPAGGLPELRDWFAAEVGGGFARQDVLICGGGQAALATALRALTQPGEPILVESPCYPGTLAAAGAAGLAAIPVPLDRDGMRPDLVEQALVRTRARVIVVQPLFQNPTGARLSAARAVDLRRIARQHNAFLIEDDYARYLAHVDAAPLPPPMAADDPDGTVLHLRSLTKATSPNLRVSALLARGPVLARLQAAQAIDSMFVPAPLQHTALEVVTATGWRRTLTSLQTALTHCRLTAVAAVDEVFGPERLALRPDGGYHLWVRLPAGWDGRTFAAAALAHGVAVTPGENYRAVEGPSAQIRISYVATASAAEAAAGIRRLAGVLNRRQ